ncbi:MAG: FAD-dependent oxidoreductase [Nocardioidaceae bacterium]
MQPELDLLVIGSGPAGEKAAALAAYHGKRVAIVERSPRPGGTFVDGVASSKTMREAAMYLTGFHRREVYGVGLDLTPEFALAGVRERARQVREVLTEAVEQNLNRHGITLVHGDALLLGDGAVRVTRADGGDSTLTASVILVATGSRPFHPPGMPFGDPDLLDSDAASELDRPIASLVIVGGGAIACEYASIFSALGTSVTLIESGPQLLRFMDADIVDMLVETFERTGVRLVLGAGHAKVDRDDEGIVVSLADGEQLHPTKVIVAAGRVGNVEGLGLAEAGVGTDERGLVVVDETFATSAPGVYAAGDVTGPPALASVAAEQGRIAACHAFGITIREGLDPMTPSGVFTIPEAAMVGLSEQAARESGEDYEVGRARLAHNARTVISGSGTGLVKLIFRRADHRLLGAHVVGDQATELIHQAQTALHFGADIDYFVNSTQNLPTTSEAYKYAAYDGLSRLENRATLTTSA